MSQKTNVRVSMQKWHEILGHRNYDDVRKLQSVVDGMILKGETDQPIVYSI